MIAARTAPVTSTKTTGTGRGAGAFVLPKAVVGLATFGGSFETVSAMRGGLPDRDVFSVAFLCGAGKSASNRDSRKNGPGSRDTRGGSIGAGVDGGTPVGGFCG